MFDLAILNSLRSLNNDEKLILADACKRLAEKLLEQVQDSRAYLRHMNVVVKKNAVRHGIPEAMKLELQFIKSVDDAALIVAGKLGSNVRNVLHHWKGHLRDQKRLERIERDREIIKMARAGKNNAEIARRYNISRPYVSKIVSRNFRRSARYAVRSRSESA